MFEVKQPFCFADPVFFDDVSRWTGGAGFVRRQFAIRDRALPAGWTRRDRGVWLSLRPEGHALREQGWKVHVSATLDNADRLCEAVWGYCVPRGIPFKHLRDPNILLAFNAKYASRGSSGKLITIYPSDDAQLETILRDLSAILDGENGPYILSDLRYGGGPLYVRYGAFVELDCVDDDGEWVHAVRRPDGVLVPDRRRPVFDPPSWVELPEFLRPHLAARRNGGDAKAGGSPPPSPYTIERALHFSNAGGIYVARRRDDQTVVILKEARPHAGMDENHDDAVRRQDREEWALRTLRGIDGIPRLYDRFVVGGHHFLAEEFIEGQPLHVWYGCHHPWVVKADPTDEEVADYTRRAVDIVTKLEALVARIHARGVVFGDLHLGNVMVRPDGSVALVDFELAFDAADTQWRPGLRATGFGRPDLRGTDLDRYSLAAVRLAIFLTFSRISDLEPAKIGQFVRIVDENFPVPDGWTDAILAELAPTAESPEDQKRHADLRYGRVGGIDTAAAQPDWPAIGHSMSRAILASATPERTDRLFPGAVEQFRPGGGLGFAYGAAGVLWALSVTGHGRHPDLERWLVDGVRRLRSARPGFYDGAGGIAYALDHLGHTVEADALVERHLAGEPPRVGMSLFSGLSGIGATLVHFAARRREAGYRDRAVQIAGRLVEAVDAGNPRLVLGPGSRPPAKPVDAGLMYGWSGVALFLTRLFEETGDKGYLDAAVRAVHRDLDRCVPVDDGALMVEEAGVRTLPYLDVGSAGISLVIDEVLAHRDDDRLADSLPPLLLASCRRFAIQAELFRGYCTQIATLARLNHRHDRRAILARHLRELFWHTIPYGGHIAFPGSLGFRLSMDLATGSAGVLLAVAAGTQRPPPFLPFFSERGTT